MTLLCTLFFAIELRPDELCCVILNQARIEGGGVLGVLTSLELWKAIKEQVSLSLDETR